MTIKRLHTKSKIFFPNPYMVRVEFPTGEDNANWEYGKMIRSAYRLLQGTWGYSELAYEIWNTDPEPKIPFTQLTANQQIASLFAITTTDFTSLLRGYVCFADEMDALQFRLTIDVKSIQVLMWPKKEFTIHEVVEEDES